MSQIVLWISLMGLVAIGYAGKYSGDQVIRIVPTTDLQVKLLQRLHEQEQYDFWTFPGRAGISVDIHVKANDTTNFAKYLNNTKMKYKVISPDVQQLLDQQDDHPHYADATGELTWFTKYHPFDEIINQTRRIASLSSRAEIVEIGKTYEGRDQLAVKIEGAPKKHRPMFFINCGIHAREWVSPATCVYIIEQLVTKYDEDQTVKRLLDKIDFIILPVLNADGYAYTWKDYGNRFWRKNRRPLPITKDRVKCVGVDLNRNFPYKWGEGGASSNPCSDIYRGTEPESELEVKNVANYLRALNTTLKAYMDIHSYSQMLMLPWGHTKEPPQDYKELLKVGNIGAEAIKKEMGADYRVGSSSNLLYQTSGSTKDFTYGELGVKYSYVFELRDKGEHGFALPTSQILPTAVETFSAIKAMVSVMDDFSKEP